MLQPSIYHAEVPPGPLRRRARLALDELDANADSVRHFLGGFHLDLEDVASAISFSATEPVRTLVARGDDLEFVLCAWLPDQATPIEEEASVPGGVRVLVGSLTEDLYAATRDGEAAHRKDSRVLRAGDVVVRDDSVIHRYRNESNALTVTLHLVRRSREPRRLPSASGPLSARA